MYNANGTKLRKTVYDVDGEAMFVNDYANGYVYNMNFGDALPGLSYFTFSEGRVLKTGSSYEYEYHAKDHLGNVRLTFKSNGTTIPEVLEKNFYYPFGMTVTTDITGDENKFKYNGKELEDEHGLNWYHYGARFYDPALCRWHTMDPADEFNSPYLYVGNNPVNIVDPDGAQAWKPVNQWNSEMQSKYSNYVSLQASYYQNMGSEYTCEDFALSLLIDFSSENLLPLKLTNGTGTYTPDAGYLREGDVAQFKNLVFSTTGANDLLNFNNTISLSMQEIKSGDLLVQRYNNGVGHHVQVFMNISGPGPGGFGGMISQGNSGWLNGIPGSSRLLGASNPISPWYTGTKIENGLWNFGTGDYWNLTRETFQGNAFSDDNFIPLRWNFEDF